MRKLVLVSFADSRFRNALARLDEYTRPFPFTERYFHTEKNSFNKQYWRSLKPWLYRRGYGYWEWKGKLIKLYLDKLEMGDYLVWSDAGVYWNSTQDALARFSEYLDNLSPECSVLAFQEPYIEEQWTKGDLLQHYGVYNDDIICKSLQLWSGVFIIMKTEATSHLIGEWASINERRKEFETDKRSNVANKSGFMEHRHDQSSFSLLVKKIPHIEISCAETQDPNRDWSKLDRFPIQARRHKEDNRPFTVVVYNKLLNPWRTLLHFYFRKVRDYDYLGNGYPW